MDKKLILFQGDSITDSVRLRDNENMMGHGYATMVAGKLGFEYPNEYEFLNRGVSGNRIVDLYARIKIDLLNLKPDYLSILIGINDVLHEEALANGVAAEKFEKIYSMLIEEIKEELPDLKMMILEPFMLKTEEREESWDWSFAETKKRAEASRRVAEKHNVVFVPLFDKFLKMAETAPASHWLMDGVHPTPAGHMFIMEEWLKAFEKIK